MKINWPLIIVLFCLCLPGVLIAVKRLVYFLLAKNTEQLKKRFSRFAIIQLLFMVLVMSFGGSVLSSRTGLGDPVLEGILQGKPILALIQPILLPTCIYALVGLIIFCIFYYGVVEAILDEQSIQAMAKVRSVLGLDGCVLYGGVVEEVIARWGLLNTVVFFGIMFAKQNSNMVMVLSLFVSGMLFAVSQLPIYLAAGCTSSRRVLYSIVVLSLWQSMLFGFVFWQYGLIAAILAHMLFHLGWGLYDSRKNPQ